MEPQNNIAVPAPAPPAPQELKETKRPRNPAQKWLLISAAGLVICLLALGIHALRGGGSPQPLPTKVLSQVFGFTPYYFTKDTPPNNLRLQANTPKFFGNALTFKLADSKQEIITVSQKAIPTPVPKIEGEPVNTSLGTAHIKTGGGRISASLTTSDKTYITLDASDFISSGTFIDIYNGLSAAPKGAEATQR